MILEFLPLLYAGPNFANLFFVFSLYLWETVMIHNRQTETAHYRCGAPHVPLMAVDEEIGPA
jgi:hypothetical protein